MPPARLPPTPASSTDISGKEKSGELASALALPPTSYTEALDRAASSTPSNYGSDSSYHPASPELSPPRKQSSISQSRSAKADDAFVLPPPPTRSRKIIQVKPKGSLVDDQPSEAGAGASSAKSGKGKRGKEGAAGRKMARKTAHSLIERRRRSKMNEEFGVLKDLIPACNGQEMHKLAILQASIEYVRYLESCITNLKAANAESKLTASPPQPTVPEEAETGEAMDHDSDSDQAMSEDNDDASATPNTLSRIPSRASLASPSIPHFTAPAAPSSSSSNVPTTTFGYNNHQRHYSISSASQASYSPYLHSTHTSPFFGPTGGHGSQDPSSSFSLSSPALKAHDARDRPQSHRGHIQHLSLSGEEQARQQQQHNQQQQQQQRREQDIDHEATAALLMLNADPRCWRDRNGRGMSVKDLLS